MNPEVLKKMIAVRALLKHIEETIQDHLLDCGPDQLQRKPYQLVEDANELIETMYSDLDEKVV